MVIPQGAICESRDGFIYYELVPVCLSNSQTAKEHFCENTSEAIERADLLDILLPMSPHYHEGWKTYGEMTFMGWKWSEDVLDLPLGNLRFMIERLRTEE